MSVNVGSNDLPRRNLAQKLIAEHLVDGPMVPGESIAIRIDQTLTQDATGTLAMLEFEAIGIPRVRTKLSAQYVDHNLLQDDYRNADDHLFLRSAARKFGLWYSRPGNGVSHPVHMERFGLPGASLLGSDSHTPAAGSLGMLAIGAGGLDVALAMAGKPYHLTMPKILGVKLIGALPDWVSAKDVILEMLRRHGVDGGVGRIVEYYGPAVATLTAMDRHVVANMGTELGATTTVFPSDDQVRTFLRQQAREGDWCELGPDDGAEYDEHDEINLSKLVPLIALPGSPGNVVPVTDVAGREIYQSYLGSSANPGLRDFAVPALMVAGKRVHERVSFDVNPTSRQILENLMTSGHLGDLVAAGARLHQAGCNGCIGMGQAPATGRISLRTVPRNFPGRSGTREDQVYLCSPETATASALKGVITDPRTLGMNYPKYEEPARIIITTDIISPAENGNGGLSLEKGPNIQPLPDFDPPGATLAGKVLLKVGDNISTDEILPAGAQVLPFRSNIPKISEFAFRDIDPEFAHRSAEQRENGSFIIAGANYGQGSSREHAALAPRYLGVRGVIAKTFSRIHSQNLINFGILPLIFADPEDYETIEINDAITIENLESSLTKGRELEGKLNNGDKTITLRHFLNDREIEIVCAGSLINHVRNEHAVA